MSVSSQKKKPTERKTHNHLQSHVNSAVNSASAAALMQAQITHVNNRGLARVQKHSRTIASTPAFAHHVTCIYASDYASREVLQKKNPHSHAHVLQVMLCRSTQTHTHTRSFTFFGVHARAQIHKRPLAIVHISRRTPRKTRWR